MNVVLQSAEAERHEPLLTELLAHVSAYNPNPDGELIGRAFDYACEYHKGQRRNSGEDFIHHPWSVAVICCDMKLDSVDDRRRAAARRRRGHRGGRGRPARGVRRRGHGAGRGRDQAVADELRQPRAGPGRELPEDDHGDGAGSARDPDQVRRPPAQHAHHRRPTQAEAGAEGQGDDRDLRAAGTPAGRPLDQVGARGPGVPDAAAPPLRRDRVDGQPAPRRPRALRRRGGRDPVEGARGAGHRGQTCPAARSTSTRSTTRWPRAARSSTRSTT